MDERDPLFAADDLIFDQQEAAKGEWNTIADDLRSIMSHPSGRRFMWRLIDRTGFWRSSFTGDKAQTDFREGMRNVGLMYWSELQRACPELLLRMQEEHKL